MTAPNSPHSSGAAGPLRLTELAPGASAEVIGIDPGSPIGARLLDLGFTPRTRVRVLRRAPLGDPVLYELRGMRLCLRRSEAAWVRVTRT